MVQSRYIYLILAIIGAATPVIFDRGWSIGTGLFDFNPGLMIGALTLTVFAANECVARKTYLPLVALPVAALFGLGAGLPFYLFLRSRPMD